MFRNPTHQRNSKSSVSQEYQRKITKEVLGELKALVKKLENGEFIIKDHGTWVSGNDSTIYYKYSVIPRD